MPEEKPLIESAEAPLTEHLEEIRQRILKCLAVFMVVFIGVYYKADQLIHWVVLPLNQCRPDLKLTALTVTEGFVTTLKLSLYAAFAVALPFVLWQVWKFIEPGLMPKERSWVKVLFGPMIVSFLIGGLFCYFFVLPLALRFLLDGMGNQFNFFFSYAGYVDFVALFLLSMGLLFELPLFLAILDGIGLLPAERLKEHRREAIVGAFILGAIASPPDVFSQLCVSIPIVLLMELGIWFSLMLRQLKKW